jgi:sec-independent protein translocase protein TatA
MFANLTGWHLLIVLAVVLFIFGAAKLPALARALGQSARILRSEAKDLHDEQGRKPNESDT